MKRLFYFFAMALCFVAYSCSDTLVDDSGSGDSILPDESYDSLESLYGEVVSVEFGEETVTVYFASGTSLEFEYPDAIIPYIGDNGNWWINGQDTGCPSTGADGSDGADGEDGKDGVDGNDGADGQNGADGADGVGIASVTYDGDKLTIVFTDGTSTSFSLGTSEGGTLVGTVDCLSDTTPMLISSLLCGDMELMSFEYDDQNRIVSAAYNTIEFNQPVPIYTMKREYTSDYQYTTTIGEVATYEGQTERVGSGDSVNSSFNWEVLFEPYTTTELMNMLCPNGFKFTKTEWNETAGTETQSDIYIKVGEPAEGISDEEKADIDQMLMQQFNESYYGCENLSYAQDDEYLTSSFVMPGEWFGYEGDYDWMGDMIYAVYVEKYPASMEFEYSPWSAFHADMGWYDDDPDYAAELLDGYPSYYNVIEYNSNTYACRLITLMQYVYAGDMFSGGNIYTNTWVDDMGEIYTDNSYEISMVRNDDERVWQYVPVVELETISYYTAVKEIDADTEQVTLVDSGVGYNEYSVISKFGQADGTYFSNGGQLEAKSYAKNSGSNNYRVYEKGAMIESASVYLTENSDGQLVGTGDEEIADEEEQIIFTMNGDYIEKIRVTYTDYSWEEYYDGTTDYNGDGIINEDDTMWREVEELVSQDVLEIEYDSNMCLSNIILYDEDGKAYSDLFNIIYDDNLNPVQIQVNGAEIAAIGDDDIDEVMELLGVATKRTTLDIETGSVVTAYAYDMENPTELLNLSYNYDYKNFFGNSLNALNIMPFGISLSNAIEEIHWAGHSSYLFSDYANFNSAGYPATAKLSASINVVELEGYGAPTISGISASVNFEYINKK